MKAFKFRLKPNQEQETKLRQIGGGCRWLWNQMLVNNQVKYNQSKKFIFGHEMCVSLPELKKQHVWLSDLPSQTLQQRCWDLNNALERRFKSGFGFPRFKRKDDNADTFRIPNSPVCIKTNKKQIKIPKLGWIDWKRHRPLQGTLKSITIKQDGNNWYVICLCDDGKPTEITEANEFDVIGIDVGLKTFAVTSDGEIFESGKPNTKRLKKYQRKLSRNYELNKKNQIKQSKRRNRIRLLVKKSYSQIKNQRYDFHQKASRQIANATSFAGMENLNIKGMMKNHCLADKIGQSGWRQFRDMLSYKLAAKGGKVLLVDRFYPSSKTCNVCGHKQDMPLHVRTFECGSCGVVLDRDINAALNLKSWAIKEINRMGTIRIYAQGDTAGGAANMEVASHVSSNCEKFGADFGAEAAASLVRR